MGLDAGVPPDACEGWTGVPSEHMDDVRRAEAALDGLREVERNILYLTIVRGMTHAEAARATGLPLGTVKTNARRGLERLRTVIGDLDEPTT